LFLISSSHLIIGILSLLCGIVNQIWKVFANFSRTRVRALTPKQLALQITAKKRSGFVVRKYKKCKVSFLLILSVFCGIISKMQKGERNAQNSCVWGNNLGYFSR
jgi:hypothetical protein